MSQQQYVYVVLRSWRRYDGSPVVGLLGVYTDAEHLEQYKASDPSIVVLRTPVDSEIDPAIAFRLSEETATRYRIIARCS